jgi:hypothetical protein
VQTAAATNTDTKLNNAKTELGRTRLGLDEDTQSRHQPPGKATSGNSLILAATTARLRQVMRGLEDALQHTGKVYGDLQKTVYQD